MRKIGDHSRLLNKSQISTLKSAGNDNTRLIDLDGDGQPEIVISEENVLGFNSASHKEGHELAQKTLKTLTRSTAPL